MRLRNIFWGVEITPKNVDQLFANCNQWQPKLLGSRIRMMFTFCDDDVDGSDEKVG